MEEGDRPAWHLIHARAASLVLPGRLLPPLLILLLPPPVFLLIFFLLLLLLLQYHEPVGRDLNPVYFTDLRRRCERSGGVTFCRVCSDG